LCAVFIKSSQTADRRELEVSIVPNWYSFDPHRLEKVFRRRVQSKLGSTTVDSREADLHRISSTLSLVAQMVSRTHKNALSVSHAKNGDPVTSLDREINELIRHSLPNQNEGWLSEESQDDLQRLQRRRVWVVDPIDGTRELIEGIPEWSVSIGLVEEQRVVAGGVLNPSTGEMFLGSAETGLQVSQLEVSQLANPGTGSEIKNNACILVSRREYGEGKWRSEQEHSVKEEHSVKVTPVGSIAYRLARVAAGYAGATCTFEPRNEWDVAAGVALIHACGGTVQTVSGSPIPFNSRVPRLNTFCAFSRHCSPAVHRILAAYPKHGQQVS
jgi:myo-inositol-1(or 4)-monophosphatase